MITSTIQVEAIKSIPAKATSEAAIAKEQKKALSAIRRMSRTKAIDIMDEAVGFSCYDDDADQVRKELRQHYLAGRISASEVFQND